MCTLHAALYKSSERSDNDKTTCMLRGKSPESGVIRRSPVATGLPLRLFVTHSHLPLRLFVAHNREKSAPAAILHGLVVPARPDCGQNASRTSERWVRACRSHNFFAGPGHQPQFHQAMPGAGWQGGPRTTSDPFTSPSPSPHLVRAPGDDGHAWWP